MVLLGVMASEPNIDRRPVPYQQILAQAAGAANVDLDAFMHAAWSAFVDARPGLRDHLEQVRLEAQLEVLRSQGKLAQA